MLYKEDNLLNKIEKYKFVKIKKTKNKDITL